jgi:peptidoglycan/xylan/chitin deacetylase (PgdA/CDA1 family)
MSKKIVIELTQDEAETLADSIGDHVSDMHDLYGCDLDEVESMAGAKKILDRLTDIRLKVLTALERSEDNKASAD